MGAGQGVVHKRREKAGKCEFTEQSETYRYVTVRTILIPAFGIATGIPIWKSYYLELLLPLNVLFTALRLLYF